MRLNIRLCCDVIVLKRNQLLEGLHLSNSVGVHPEGTSLRGPLVDCLH